MGWAFHLTRGATGGPDALRKSRARFADLNALKPPFVARGDTRRQARSGMARKMDEWANEWTRYYTGDKGNYMVAAM